MLRVFSGGILTCCYERARWASPWCTVRALLDSGGAAGGKFTPNRDERDAMTIKRRTCTALFGLAVFGSALTVAGCGNGAGTPSGTDAAPHGAASPTGATSSAHAAAYDVNKVCDLLTPGEIEAATGTAVQAGAIRDSQPGHWVECRYPYTSDTLDVIRVQLATPANAADYFTAAEQDVTTESISVPGADKARWDGAFSTVYIAKGGISFFVQIEDEKPISQTKTESLAVAAIANLAKLS
jgi:hypothetical protein